MKLERNNKSLKFIYELISNEKYAIAYNIINELPEQERKKSIYLFLKAVCIYEEGNDIECLKLLVSFLEEEPLHERKNYSIFTAAICLINLGLEEIALKLFKILPSDYPDLQKEIEQINAVIKRKIEAQTLANALLLILNQQQNKNKN